jgi:hypothetical protein
MNNINSLSLDCIGNIFSNLSPQELANCCRVSKLWEQIASQDRFWSQLGSEIGVTQDYKKHLNSYGVSSFEDLFKHFERFISQVSSEGTFNCVFPFNKDCHIRFQCGWNFGSINAKDVKAEYVFMRKLSDDLITISMTPCSYCRPQDLLGYFFDQRVRLPEGSDGWQVCGVSMKNVMFKQLDILKMQFKQRQERIIQYNDQGMIIVLKRRTVYLAMLIVVFVGMGVAGVGKWVWQTR